jgi:hypothetical protein
MCYLAPYQKHISLKYFEFVFSTHIHFMTSLFLYLPQQLVLVFLFFLVMLLYRDTCWEINEQKKIQTCALETSKASLISFKNAFLK